MKVCKRRERKREREEEKGREEMGSGKVGACEECTLKCMSIHDRKGPLPVVTSFFKIMIGDRFSRALFVPPQFAQTLASSVDQKIYLEDRNGQQWRVTLSTLDGSLAFQQGWHEFALDHCLEIGDFVVFKYIIGSHFVVHIYGKSGCEKVNFFEKGNNSKGKRTRPKNSLDHLPSDVRNSKATEGPCHTIDKASVNEQGSSSTVRSDSDIEIIQSKCNVKHVEKVPMDTDKTSHCDNSNTKSQPVSPVDYTEVPFYMIDRDPVDRQVAHGTSHFDLSNFEMLETKSGADGMDKVPVVIEKENSPHFVNSVRPQATLKMGCIEEQCHIIDKESVAEEGASRGAPFDVSDFKIPERKCNARDTDKVPCATKKISSHGKTSQWSQTKSKVDSENEMGNLDMSNGAFRKYPLTEEGNCVYSGNDPVIFQMERTPPVGSSESVPHINTKMSGYCKNPVTMEGKNYQTVKELKIVKEHEVKVKENHGKKPVVVKLEQEEMVYPSVEVEGEDCKVVKTERLDSNGLSSPNSFNIGCSVSTVTQSYLEMPMDLPSFSCKGKSRMERRILVLRDPAMRVWPVMYHDRAGFRALVSGWEHLANANNIQQGDVCVFEVENESEGLFRVSITRK